MRLQKMGHACVRLQRDDDAATLVIDPGELTEPEAMAGASAVLITHEHVDHLDEAKLDRAFEADSELVVWTNHAVADRLSRYRGRVRGVGAGDGFSAAGFDVRVYGELHAVIHPDLPRVANVGFLVDGEVFHPGDAFTVPDRPVGTLLAPTNAPWMKAAEMIDYVREIRPHRAYSVHDGLLNDFGLGLVDGLLARLADETGADCRRLRPGESVRTG
jgi:L-ascorbate metabolism protein UlaG (beta-lactamase superfamily)